MNEPNIFLACLVLAALVLFYVMAGCMFVVEILLEREDKWNTKQGWAENSIITLVWPIVLAGAFCRWNSNKKLADRLDMTTATRVMAESGKRCLLLKA